MLVWKVGISWSRLLLGVYLPSPKPLHVDFRVNKGLRTPAVYWLSWKTCCGLKALENSSTDLSRVSNICILTFDLSTCHSTRQREMHSVVIQVGLSFNKTSSGFLYKEPWIIYDGIVYTCGKYISAFIHLYSTSIERYFRYLLEEFISKLPNITNSI